MNVKDDIHIRIDHNDHEQLKILVKESLGLNKTDILRIAIKEYLMRNADIIENYYKELEKIRKETKSEN